MDVKDGERATQVGLVTLLVQLNKAIHRRSTEEMLGMRLKAYIRLSYIRDHPGVTQQELETAMVMDANSVVLILNELDAAQFSLRRRDAHDRRRRLLQPTASGRPGLQKDAKAP